MANQPEEKSKRASEGQQPLEPTAQRPRMENRRWLAPPVGGQRHTRIGGDFQVAALPEPSKEANGEKESDKETAEADAMKEVVKEEELPITKKGK